MTTESASLPGTARATTLSPASSTVHRPRGGPVRRYSEPVVRQVGRHRLTVLLMGADALVATLAPAVGPAPRWPVAVFAVQAAAQVLLHSSRGLYRPRLSRSAAAEFPAVLGLTLLQWFVTAETLTTHDTRYAIGWTTLLCAVGVQTLFCCVARGVLYRAGARAAARHPRPTLVVGSGPLARSAATALRDRTEYGLRAVGRVALRAADAGPAADDGAAGRTPVLRTREEVGRTVVRKRVGHVLFTEHPAATPEGTELFSLLTGHGCRMWLIEPPATGAMPEHRPARPDHLWGYSAHRLLAAHRRPFSHAAKRAMDLVLASVALLAASPALLACACAVRLCDGPGVLFRQERLGLHGRPFTLLKFRTLRPADAHESATRWNVAGDRRMSAVGKALRRTSLDELPQLWNVLRGDMSLVGPRPERPFFAAQFSTIHPGYQARHRMPVGITGLAQVNGLRGDTSIEDRARFDNRYIETWSLWQDVCVLARTVLSLFRCGGS
ncbi:exopolysaccharide biosynthesis polyprenyl glycosylphosphotransferase [Streptomyces sp. NBC_01335]|uniref:exopolysaccharide biosynthesis polyprenyl glycosylphosphotransferase n=1 Tax=Streptomyces sp. NBC_01335 TaxID=2903828 RepID=UPI002E0FCDB8|nr:exopolysaccharide biosynthesis polyprenyl glycosylphosphotransferase [Streptomyces sp. NBC_01335]